MACKRWHVVRDSERLGRAHQQARDVRFERIVADCGVEVALQTALSLRTAKRSVERFGERVVCTPCRKTFELDDGECPQCGATGCRCHQDVGGHDGT